MALTKLSSTVTDSTLATTASPTFTGTVTLPIVVEPLDPKTSATGVVTHDISVAPIFYHSSIAANFTANFTNVPTTNNRITTVALILAQGATAYIPSAVQIAGVGQTINWPGGVTPTGSPSRTDIATFTLIRQSSTWSVLGSLSGY